MSTQTFIGTLVVMECGECHVHFGMTTEMNQRKLNDGTSWYCPNGHGCVYGESEIQKLEKEVERIKANEQWEREAKERAYQREKVLTHRMAAHKGVAKRLKNRIANGVCPCCKRTFQNLMYHMHNQHPDWKKHE